MTLSSVGSFTMFLTKRQTLFIWRPIFILDFKPFDFAQGSLFSVAKQTKNADRWSALYKVLIKRIN